MKVIVIVKEHEINAQKRSDTTTERCLGLFPDFRSSMQGVAEYLFDEMNHFMRQKIDLNVGGCGRCLRDENCGDYKVYKIRLKNEVMSTEYEFKTFEWNEDEDDS